MPTTAMLERSECIEFAMEAKAQSIRRIEMDPLERRVLVQLVAETKEALAENTKAGERLARLVAKAEWLMKFDGLENKDHDGTDSNLEMALRAFEGQKANRRIVSATAQAS